MPAAAYFPAVGGGEMDGGVVFVPYARCAASPLQCVSLRIDEKRRSGDTKESRVGAGAVASRRERAWAALTGP